MATLNYRHFATAARFALARITIVSYYYKGRKESSRAFFDLFYLLYYSARGATATRVAKMPIIQGCHPRRFFISYIYL